MGPIDVTYDANGEFVTKHHAVVLYRQPVNKPVENLDLQDDLDANYGEVPEVLSTYSGSSVLETYSLWYSRDGQPERAALICKTPDNKRHLAAVNDAATLQALISAEKEMIGASGIASTGDDGFNYWVAS